MPKPLIFLGCNSNLLQYVEVCEFTDIPVAGIIDSDYHGNTDHYLDVPVIGSETTADFDELKKHFDFFIGINPTTKRNAQRRDAFIHLIEDHQLPCANLIDPTARINRSARLGTGNYIGFCASVSTNVKIGNHCQVHSHSIIGDNTEIENNVTIQRRCTLNGFSMIGSGAYLGIGTILIKRNRFPFVKVGKNSWIWPGLTIMRDVGDYETVTSKNFAKRTRIDHEKN